MTTNLRTSLAKTDSLVDLFDMVKEAKEEISFWGHSYVYISGYEGTLPINALALKVMYLVNKNKNFDQDSLEKDALEEITPLINHIFYRNEERAEERSHTNNPLILLIDSIRKKIEPLLLFFSLRSGDPRFCAPDISEFDAKKIWFRDFADEYKKAYHPNANWWLIPQLTHEFAQTAISSASTFDELLPIVTEATTTVSFLGLRYLEFKMLEGKLPIYSLIDRVKEIEKENLDFENDSSYQEIQTLLNDIYQRSDNAKEERFLVTRIFCSVRDIWTYHSLSLSQT